MGEEFDFIFVLFGLPGKGQGRRFLSASGSLSVLLRDCFSGLFFRPHSASQASILPLSWGNAEGCARVVVKDLDAVTMPTWWLGRILDVLNKKG